MAAMRRGDEIRFREMGAHSGGDRLLADREMDRALDVPILQRLLRGFLEGADARHGAVMPQHALAIEIRLAGHPPKTLPDREATAPLPSYRRAAARRQGDWWDDRRRPCYGRHCLACRAMPPLIWPPVSLGIS